MNHLFKPTSRALIVASAKRPGYYAVAKGRKTGIFDTWEDCNTSVHRFPNAIFKKFSTKQEAAAFIAEKQGKKEKSSSLEKKKAPNKQPSVEDYKLSADQQLAFTTLETGGNVFLTGPPGTGKSYTIKKIRKHATDLGQRVAMTALTGAAAVLLDGLTVHSYLGIGLAKPSAERLAYWCLTEEPSLEEPSFPSTTEKRRLRRLHRLQRLDLLIIDEISMMNSELFAKVSEFLSLVRKDPTPFGGIQVVLSGDFCQLPPVKGDYCFLSPEWKRANLTTVQLTSNYRQSGDALFQELLSELRWGICTPETQLILNSLKKTTYPKGIAPTRLYSLRADTDARNKKELALLVKKTGAKVTLFKPRFRFSAIDPIQEAKARQWAKTCGVSEPVPLAKGAQVVLIYNIDTENGLVNGSRGKVVSISAPTHVSVRFYTAGQIVDIKYRQLQDEDEEEIGVSYLPLKLAYALTITKSQGMTLDCVEMDLGPTIFENGQAYTALSRARSLKQVRMLAFDPRAFRADPRVIDFLQHQNPDSSSDTD